MTATPSGLSKMRELITRLDVIELQEVRHWIMVEAKDEVNSGSSGLADEIGLSRGIEAMTRRVYCCAR
jgi:hypothetical protein